MQLERSVGTLLRFGVFELDTSAGQLMKSGRRVALAPQPLKVLEVLARRPGELVTREELRQAIWSADTFVDFEQGLNFCIKRIRSVLGDNADSPRYIETVPRRGYRFVAPVSEVALKGEADSTPAALLTEPRASTRSASRWPVIATAAAVAAIAGTLALWSPWRSPPVAPATGRTMLAVLPFEHVGPAGDEYITDGLTDELIGYLGGLDPERLAVIARTSTARYKGQRKSAHEIARELNAMYLVEGSVRHVDGHLRVTAALVRAADQTQVWSATYEDPLENPRGMHRQLAEAIGNEIRLKVSPPAPARRVEAGARQLYLQGRFFWSQRREESYKHAIELFEKAVQRDPHYAAAYAGLADAYALLGSTSNAILGRADAMARARSAAEKAIAIDPTEPEAHASLGFVKMHFDWDWEGAEASFKRAITLNPSYATAHHWYAYYLVSRNRLDEALAEITLARQLDPLSPAITRDVGEIHYFAGRYPEAIQYCREALAMDNNFWLARLTLGWALEKTGQRQEAIEEYKKMGRAAEAAFVAGRRKEAQRLAHEEVRDLPDFKNPSQVASIYGFVELKDEALRWLERAYELREGAFIVMKYERHYDSLHDDTRFLDLARRVGLP